MTDEDAFTAFVAQRQMLLLRLCWALTGDRHRGEDLAQAVLDRLWRRWAKVSAGGDDPWPYTQRIAVSLASTWRRRLWSGEVATGHIGDRAESDRAGQLADRDEVARWLAVLARQQRAVIVLRFLADLSVEQTAVVLGCTSGTVKSQTAKALARLRTLAEQEVLP